MKIMKKINFRYGIMLILIIVVSVSMYVLYINIQNETFTTTYSLKDDDLPEHISKSLNDNNTKNLLTPNIYEKKMTNEMIITNLITESKKATNNANYEITKSNLPPQLPKTENEILSERIAELETRLKKYPKI